MASTDEKVMQLVEDELKIDPDMKSSDLFEKARAIFPGVDKLSLRQFHARYPLQIKRRIAMEGTGKSSAGKKRGKARAGGRSAATKKATSTAAKSTTRKATKKAAKKTATRRGPSSATRSTATAPSEGRDQVRQVLLRFAGDLSAADERKDVVKVLTGIDGYVNDVMQAVS